LGRGGAIVRRANLRRRGGDSTLTRIQVRSDQPINVHIWDRGRIYPAHVAQNVFTPGGNLVIPAGSPAELIIRQTGLDQMALDVESITVNGARYAMDTTGPNFHMPPGAYNSGAGLIGSVVRAIAGGQVQVETQGDGIVVPAEATLTFQLEQPLHVVTWYDPGYTHNGDHYHNDGDWYR
jgi:hypothetical protein